MPAPAGDFLGSLTELFNEAGRNGRDAKIEFAPLRGMIIEFVSACSRMTAAKARARCNLKFIDGNEPKTLVALPPGKFRIDDENRTRLKASSDGAEFVAILQGLISKQVSPPRRSPRGHNSKKIPNNTGPESPKGKAQQRIEAESAKKNKKQLVRLKLRYSGEQQPIVDATVQQTVPLDAERTAKMASEPLPKDARQPNPRSISEPAGNGQPSAEIVSNNMPGPMDIDSSAEPSATPTPVADSGDFSIVDDVSPATSSDSQGDTQMVDVAATEPGIPTNRRPGIQEVAAQVFDVQASDWDTFKPKLLAMLAEMHADPTTDEIHAALERLNMAISKIDSEKAFIPAGAWEKYEKDLVKAARKGWFEKTWLDRRYKIGRIFYLKEEEAVIVNRDWERLRAAARIWAIVSEMTAPPQEAVDEEAVNKWLAKKLSDIRFLERLFSCKERIATIKGPSEK
ncbi:hypothetical protein ACJ41O_008597 [Fusarium nematophilum]